MWKSATKPQLTPVILQKNYLTNNDFADNGYWLPLIKMKIITFCIIASPKSFEAGISEKFIWEAFDVLCNLTF